MEYALTNNQLIKSKITHSDTSAQLFIKDAYWCYQNLVVPLMGSHTNINQLIIIADHKLGHLPFELFLTKDASNEGVIFHKLPYLIHQYNISYNYSAALWLESQIHQNTPANNKILAMAASYDKGDTGQYNLRLPAHNRIRNKLYPLPAAQNEVKRLSKIYKGYFGFDTLASEGQFKEMAPQFGIIHLAMHGQLNPEFPMLSSLVFTENGDRHENNLLQAYEISNLELQADLVVLSACESGYGKFEHGNGTASLARAFMYAGVPSLIVSLWQVDDLATSKIMSVFYEQLSQGKNKAEALRQAKLSYLENARGIKAHPAYWSPFIQLGNAAPTNIEKRSNFWYIGWVVALCVLGLILYLIRSSKHLKV